MAKPNDKKKKDEGANYNEAVAALRANGPQRLYVLCGREDYLREQFYARLREACLPGGEDEFSFHRFDGAEPDLIGISAAVDSMPFLSERSLVEIRGCDLNRLGESDSDRLQALIADIPEWCTLVFLMPPDVLPDGRLRVTKAIKKHGEILQFNEQDPGNLIKWVARRFDAWNKRITIDDAQYLIAITGGLMNRMIPEIDKISAYAADAVVTRADIDAVTEKTPDAVVYELTDRLSEGDRDGAMAKLTELLSMKDNDPIMILAVIGVQLRRLYAARAAREANLPESEAMALCDVRYGFLVQRAQRAARRFSPDALERAVLRCAETDYAMKHSGRDNVALLEEFMLSLMEDMR